MAQQSFNSRYSDAWSRLKLESRRRPDEVFPRFKKEDFDNLKQKYTDTHGYVIKIPQIDDIVHVVPKSLKTLDDIKQEKRQGLSQILASPTPNWARKYSTVMTYLDDIQDATSLIYPAISMLARWAPKVMGKIIPTLGWMMLGSDLLNLAIGIGRLPMGGMAGKRLNCEVIKHNPFTKKARWDRANRLLKYKPGIADLIQAAQTTDNVIGVGLSLGPLMGFIMDAAFGAYRYATGERVRFSTEVPIANEHEVGGRNALKASALINTQGQTFTDDQHFWSLTMGAVGGRLFLPYCMETDIAGSVEDPMSIMIPADYPKDPLTIEIIKERGLDVDAGHGWPINGAKEMMLGDIFDYIVQNTQDSVTGYWNRHPKDWNGYVTAICWDQILPASIYAFDPGVEPHYEDSEIARVCYTCLKAPLLPTRKLNEGELEDFFRWVKMIYEMTKRPPGLLAIKEKFDAMKIPYREAYPTTREPEADELFPPDLNINQYTSY